MVPEAPHDVGAPPLSVTPLGATLIVPEVARFRIQGGNSILVDRCGDASDRNVRLFLLGSAMGVLLHQLGILPLHANAIAIDGAAVAFLGHSGAGKSTLAAAFHDRGNAILSDDVCALVRRDETFVVEPGIPRLRLWRDAVERSGRDPETYERAFDAIDKYTVRTEPDARCTAMPLRVIYLLARDEVAGPKVRPLTGLDGMRALMENTYRGDFIGTVGEAPAHFQTCLALSREVPVFELVRPWDSRSIDATIAYVEAHLRALPGVAL
ncbi:hypothetical protein CVN68_22050 [Sphingomonas psychrotolerans]|uniref:HPr kinase/phosphorylase C-terminal domain-containing protein n=1 Tax=Sphingomonas psychrotolerans TaxID=1327635 RepID=A0A2K8MK99_9SPHN|nr:hypothetical protein CVN68_22050 [Sphingomonas psychrotolerans]